jgi:hypothetical protein
MNAHAEKSPNEKNRSSTNRFAEKQESGLSRSGLSGNRPEAAAQRRVLEMANTGYRAMQLKRVQDIADQSQRVRTMTQLWAIANAASRSSQYQGEVVQRVLIGGVNITSKTSRKTIEDALQWTKLYGIGRELTTEQRKQLITELEAHGGCGDIVEILHEDLEEANEPSNDGSGKVPAEEESQEEEAFGDLLRLTPFIGTASTESKEEARRRKAAEDFGWNEFPETFRDLKKVGVHETKGENVDSLIANGPSPVKLGTGHGLGKGPGFYVSHVGQRTLYNAIKGISYGERFLAVYVPSDLMAIRSTSEQTNNTDVLDKTHGGEFCYYVMSGGSEVVIPVRCFGLITLVSNLDELVTNDDEEEDEDQKQLVQAIYEEELDFAKRMNVLSYQYNQAESPTRKKSIAKKWNWLQNVLFNRWSMNGRQYTLWLDTMRVGELVAAPRRPR